MQTCWCSALINKCFLFNHETHKVHYESQLLGDTLFV